MQEIITEQYLIYVLLVVELAASLFAGSLEKQSPIINSVDWTFLVVL